jgi:predicted transport protein
MLTQSDKRTLVNVIDGIDPPKSSAVRVIENNRFFEEKISTCKTDLGAIYEGIAKLILVDISLNRDHDNPQLIFESLNSTGLELSQADLIRNYILMDLDPEQQNQLYQKFWFPMEQLFGQVNYKSHFDRFMRDYLTLKMGTIPNIREVYDEFKRYCQHGDGQSIDEIVADIFKFSIYFVNMVFGQEEEVALKRLFDDINMLKVDVAYPFLLEVYDDYAQGKLSKEHFIEMMELIQSYVFRRAICGIPTNSLNKTFATLARTLDKDNYLASFKTVMVTKDSYRRFPSDEEFVAELKVKDVYSLRSRNFLLTKLENYQRKEHVDIGDYTIEHIMPQKEDLTEEWKRELGENWKEVFNQYLHTIGNLTLTGYNSELSCKPFLEKRDMVGGFADSPIRLNRDLAKLSTWNEAHIVQRAISLSQMAKTLWAYPVVPDEVIQIYRSRQTNKTKRSYTLEDHKYLQGETGGLFVHLRKRILNLDSSVTEEILKQYIAYKSTTNFVDVVPKKTKLRLHLNMKFEEIDDPKGICEDVTGKGHWGNGDVKVNLKSSDEIDYVMSLIQQSFDRNMESRDG